jgi:hypothetical protein
MKLATLFLLIGLFATTAIAEGNQGSGGRGIDGTVKVIVKDGQTTEDGDPPPPACVPSETETCDGNQGSGGRSASTSILLFVQKYLIAIFG